MTKEILNSDQIRKMFDTTEVTIAKMRNEMELPNFKIGRSYFYVEKHVLKWCEKQSDSSIKEKPDRD